jgi:hypothetical protein
VAGEGRVQRGKRSWHALCCLRHSTMLRSTRFLGLASLVAMSLVTTRARGQSISASGQIYPDRIANGVNLGSSTRAQNLNPFGINYVDCTTNMTLEFNVLLSNFNGGQLAEVWAGTTDCTSDAARGRGGIATCWLVAQPIAGVIAGAGSTVPLRVDVRAQDVVGHQSNIPIGGTYVPAGATACQSQTVDTAQSFTLYFLPTDSSGNALANSGTYKYSIQTDLVGPPAPTGVSIADGDTLMVVKWVANNDADTAGYNVYMDPIPGLEGVTSASTGAEPVLVCPDAGASTAIDATADAGNGGSTIDVTIDAATDASNDASPADAALDAPPISDASTQVPPVCVYQTSGGAATNLGTCGSQVLASSSSILDASTSAAPSAVDEAGNVIEGGTTTTGPIGISNIPPLYLLNAGSTGVTVSDKAAGSYTVTGLKNGTTYNVVVAAVDGSGNVGPTSQEQCDFPAPVNDFWSLYRSGGGRAGGGFCALEAVGEPARSAGGIALAGVIGALVLRRRRTTR